MNLSRSTMLLFFVGLIVSSASRAQEPLVPLSMDYASDRPVLVDFSHYLEKPAGRGPTVVEPVRGSVYLHGLEEVKSVHVTPLSPIGKRLDHSVVVRQLNEVWEIELDTPVATWYLIRVERDEVD